ncbi:SRPBCC family protein [Nocardia huaxiensis]|uniref:SRPBCC domain-containing protein n=1 Tax=Nocardia huaxiensis TaxID=2755382 RepID=A0A7D6V949_9NOCA|nr:SRPBCC domain-containing protein [Nocardia huaxiensis]QLY29433.1 SRPBCC domain-containing protein [Nocardia huaxiensis]UFS97018.1 SRPBCC domain-containing protein [Nocardia huaxiensis]
MNDTATSIELDHYYPHPPEKVWRAITTPHLMGQWMMEPIGFEPVAGNRFEMKTQPMPGQNFSGEISGEVLEAIAPEVLRITWNDARSETPTGWVISWALRPEGHGTRILFSHTGFDPDDAVMQRSRSIMGPGWAAMLDRLAGVIDAV